MAVQKILPGGYQQPVRLTQKIRPVVGNILGGDVIAISGNVAIQIEQKNFQVPRDIEVKRLGLLGNHEHAFDTSASGMNQLQLLRPQALHFLGQMVRVGTKQLGIILQLQERRHDGCEEAPRLVGVELTFL